MNKTERTWTVGYRTGTPDKFRWRRVGKPFATLAQAMTCRSKLIAMGYPAYVYITSQLDSIGLPDTYASDDKLPR